MTSAVWWSSDGTTLYGRVRTQGQTQAGEQRFGWRVRDRDRQHYERAMVARLDRYARGDGD